ncbi:MAG: sigma-70 family RNA polymerase sigma factor [Candidatus Margulisiibacteriota bacterium]
MTLDPDIEAEVYRDLIDYLVGNHSELLFQIFQKKITQLVNNYAYKLPHYIKDSELDDLYSIASMEFIQTLRAWEPHNNPVVWPFSYSRINGAMRDHIRYLTKADPSRIYNWVTDAAYMYLAINRNKEEFAGSVEDGVTLKQAMRNLSESEQKVVTLKIVNDLTLSDIGKEVGLSESQVSRIYRAAVEKLKKILSK